MTGIYRQRWQWWAPWSTVHPWLPRVFRGHDEFCNPSVGVVLPPLGSVVVFYKPGRQRTTPCEECQLYQIGADIDLDVEEVYTKGGERLTEACAQEMADDAIRRVRSMRGDDQP